MPAQAILTATTVATAFAAAVTALSNTPASSLSAPGIYNGSSLPASLAWNTYNYCNAPHVNAEHYPGAPPHNKLIYVTSFQRHAKRTPDNLLPGIDAERLANPPEGWDCATDYEVLSSAGTVGVVGVQMETSYNIPAWHPLSGRIWNGTCSSGQLTRGGWEDAHKHGEDFMAVYGPGGAAQILSNHCDEACDSIMMRASPSARTAQVASAFLSGMGVCHRDGSAKKLIVQPDTIDGIVPSYSCPHADTLRTAIEATPVWKQHLAEHAHVFAALHVSLPTTKNVTAWNSWIDHSFDALASRQCHGHPLPRGAEGAPMVSQETADEVYAMGDWEYDYIWNKAGANGTGDLADEYVRYGSAVLVDELVRDLKAVASAHAAGEAAMPLVKLFVGHDGTMVRLLKTLAQSGAIRWPAMGSEVVIEVWRQDGCGDDKKEKEGEGKGSQASRLFVRIFAYGTLLETDAEKLRSRGSNSTTAVPGSSSQSGIVQWTPLEDVIEYLEQRIPADLVEKCAPSLSS